MGVGVGFLGVGVGFLGVGVGFLGVGVGFFLGLGRRWRWCEQCVFGDGDRTGHGGVLLQQVEGGVGEVGVLVLGAVQEHIHPPALDLQRAEYQRNAGGLRKNGPSRARLRSS